MRPRDWTSEIRRSRRRTGLGALQLVRGIEDGGVRSGATLKRTSFSWRAPRLSFAASRICRAASLPWPRNVALSCLAFRFSASRIFCRLSASSKSPSALSSAQSRSPRPGCRTLEPVMTGAFTTTIGRGFRLLFTVLAALLLTAGVVVGIVLAVQGVRLLGDLHNPKAPRAREAIFSHPQDFLSPVQHARNAQVSGVKTLHHLWTGCWRGLTLVILFLLLNALSTPPPWRKQVWLSVLFAGITLLFFLACSRAASPAGLGLPVPAHWPPDGPLRGAAMYADVLASREMMKRVEESWIAAGVLTSAAFAALLWQTMKLTRSPW